jgi:hypothetical protein
VVCTAVEETREEPADDADGVEPSGRQASRVRDAATSAVENGAAGHLERREDFGQERGRRVGDVQQLACSGTNPDDTSGSCRPQTRGKPTG